MPHLQEITAEMQRCIQRCTECHNICTQTITHCLMLGGEHADPSHIGLLMDCAQICETSADFMMRASHRHVKVCGLCEDICKACAEECERTAGGDRTMMLCAEACRRCAESCHDMSGSWL